MSCCYFKLVSSVLWCAHKVGLVKDYCIDLNGWWYSSLVRAKGLHAVRSETELPYFASWKDGESRFLKVARMVVVYEV